MAGSTVVNTSYPPERVDLADGRVLEPGGHAESVDVKAEHNRLLLDAGKIQVAKSHGKEG